MPYAWALDLLSRTSCVKALPRRCRLVLNQVVRVDSLCVLARGKVVDLALPAADKHDCSGGRRCRSFHGSCGRVEYAIQHRRQSKARLRELLVHDSDVGVVVAVGQLLTVGDLGAVRARSVSVSLGQVM